MTMKIVDVEKVYNEEKDLKKEHVKQLMEWADKQPHLPKISELLVCRFLSSCYYNSEFAKVTIEQNATMRLHLPELFQNRNLKSIEKSANTILICLLPRQTPEGYHMTFLRLLDTDPANYHHRDHLKILDMLGSIWLVTLTSSLGQVIIIDAVGVTFSHVMRMDLSFGKKCILYFQNALPLRLKSIHLLNVNSAVEKIINIFRPFIKCELLDAVTCHKNMESFYKYVPQECLPNEYGGKAGTMEELQKISIQHLKDYEDYLKEEEHLVVDESKRVAKIKDVSEVFGIEGTFKKLDID